MPIEFNKALEVYGTKNLPLYASRWEPIIANQVASFVYTSEDLKPLKVYFGLEMELPFDNWRNSNTLFPTVLKSLQPFGTCYYDAGIEVVTSPATYEGQKKILEYFWKRIESAGLVNLPLRKRSGCHVHIDTEAFSRPHFLRFSDFFQEPSLFRIRTVIAQRYPNKFCSVNGNGRYRGLNTYTHHGTHEVRIFRHPRNFLEAAKNLDFVKSIHDFTQDERPVSGKEYLHWLKSARSYPYLREFIEREKLALFN